MAANIYIILIQVPGEKAILLMKSTLIFVSKGACAHMTFLFFALGSGAYNIFHPLLFQKALDVLRLWPCKGVLNSNLFL